MDIALGSVLILVKVWPDIHLRTLQHDEFNESPSVPSEFAAKLRRRQGTNVSERPDAKVEHGTRI